MANQTAIIVAAGRSSRMRGTLSKQYLPVGDRVLLAYSLEVFQRAIFVDSIILVIAPGDCEYVKSLIHPERFPKLKKIVEGGRERYQSVYNGLLALEEGCEVVWVHDVA